VIILATLMLGPIYFLGKVIGKEFAPSEDISMFMAQLEAPVGTSFEAMDDLLQQVENVILSQPEVYSGFAAIDLDDRGQVNTGVMFCQLIKPHLRQRSQHQLVADLRRELAEIKGVDARLIEFSFYNFGGEGGDFPVSYSIRGPDLEVLDTVGRKMMERLAEIKGVVDLDTNLDLEQPQVHLRVDRERAHDLGLDASTVFSTVYSLVAGREIGSYTSGGKRYEVHIKMLPSQIRTPEDIGALQIRTPQGRMVRLDSLIDLEYALGPININRTDRERSLLLQGNLEGVALGDVTGKIESILDEELPDGYTWRAAGQAEEMRQAGGSLIFAMALAVIIVYMLLASQFNSLIHPFTIMLALPPALLGALLALVATGSTLNIMSMIGIILLFGLVTKNSILLVDLTIQRQAAGLEADEALRVACPIRLRPILMTAVSMIFGVLPVALALGEGGEARAPMAIATAGGMTTSTLMTLFVVPVVYSLLESSTRLLRRGRREPIAEPAPDDNGSS